MLQRMLGLLLVVAGLALVAGLMLIGTDLQRAADRGPRWRRRLIGLGLGLLGGSGLLAVADQARGDRPAAQTVAQAGSVPTTQPANFDDLPARAEWKHLAAVWAEASRIAAGEGGAYPFDEKGKQRLLADLEGVTADVKALRNAGLLSETEATLLDQDRERLVTAVRAKRPTELKLATCYEPMPFFPAKASAERLSQQLDLLDKLAAADMVQPEVLARVVDSVAYDLATMSDAANLKYLAKEDKKKIEALTPKAQARLDALRARTQPAADSLETTPEWRTVVQAWKAVVPLARGGRSSTPQRKAVEAKLAEAKAAIEKLVTEKQLDSAESELLIAEAGRLQSEMYSTAPDDPVVPVCYTPAAFGFRARSSMERLARQLPLLQKMVAGKQLHAAVARKILPVIEEDMETLNKKDELDALSPVDRKKALRLRQDVEQRVKQLKAAVEAAEK